MKTIVSVSLGSSRRDHAVEVTWAGELVRLERRGCDGDMGRASALLASLDGHVDAIGLGGIDLYVYAGSRRYEFRDARRLASVVKKTPVVDGSRIKHTLERETIKRLAGPSGMPDAKVLLVSAVDRFGMAEAFHDAGAQVLYGDLMFGLGIPIGLRSLRTVERLARVLLPVVTRLPFKWLYPTGAEQERRVARFENAYRWADIVAGDWHLINRHLPAELKGKTIITNTLTPPDREALRERGVKRIVTTTPEMSGRAFGTNVIEGAIAAFAGDLEKLGADECSRWIERLGIQSTVTELDAGRAPTDDLQGS
jgi:hypothetical protein